MPTRRANSSTARPASDVATHNDVRRVALSLPETTQASDDFAFSVRNGNKDKGFAWVWKERVAEYDDRNAR
jgi:hypothetical protein